MRRLFFVAFGVAFLLGEDPNREQWSRLFVMTYWLFFLPSRGALRVVGSPRPSAWSVFICLPLARARAARHAGDRVRTFGHKNCSTYDLSVRPHPARLCSPVYSSFSRSVHCFQDGTIAVRNFPEFALAFELHPDSIYVGHS